MAQIWAFCFHNMFSVWHKSEISLHQLQFAFEKYCRDYPLTSKHCNLSETGPQLATPRQSTDVYALIDRQVNKSYVSLTELAVSSKMGKACNELLLRENRDLKRSLEQQEVRRKRLPGPEGMFITPDNRGEVSNWLRERRKEEKCTKLRRDHLQHLQQHIPVWESRKRLGRRSLLPLRLGERQQGSTEEEIVRLERRHQDG